MDAGKRDITAIFNKARSLEIPFYQRSYVWERDNWERFANDLISVGVDQTDYFLGSIILKQKNTNAGSSIGDVRAVVDGQQRLTSLVLFFRVLCDATGRPDFFREIFVNLAGDLTLQHNHNDIEIFSKLSLGQPVEEPERDRFASSRVLQAYDYFRGRSSEIAQLKPMVLIQRLYFVGIDLAHDENEQQIFDTINSLGVDLTTAELLKNELFDRTDLDLYKRTWLPTFEKNEAVNQYWTTLVTSGRSRRQNIDLFLQAQLLNNLEPGGEVRVADLFADYKAYLVKLQTSRVAFITDLTAAAQTYQSHVDPDVAEEAIDSASRYDRLNLIIFALQTTTVMPFYLHILRNVPNAHQGRMLWVLESYLIRRLVSGMTAKHYNKYFAALSHSGTDTYSKLFERFTRADDPSTEMPNDATFKRGFETTNLTNQQARVVLFLLESSIRDETRHSTSLASFSHYTLEHVMPRKWQNHWGQADDAERRNSLVTKLGNFTLLSAKLNSSIRDANWPTKKTGAGRNSGLLRYGAGLEIFDRDLSSDSWSEENIEARGKRFADLAIDIWPYEL